MLRQTGRETKMAAVEGVSAETKLRGGGDSRQSTC